MLDFYEISEFFTGEERGIQTKVRELIVSEVMPHIQNWWNQGVFPKQMIRQFAKLGLFGSDILVGQGSISNVAYGLIMYELERGDSGLRSFASVQNALVMYPIQSYGSDSQRKLYLPALASGDIVGCFGLTEQEGGSDPKAIKTTAIKDGDSYILNGVKRWVTNGDIADIAIIWARDDQGDILGFVVPKEVPGLTVKPIEQKMSLRVSSSSELLLRDVRVPVTHILPSACGLFAPLACLTQARYGILWGVLGALEAVYLESLEFAKTRSTFGRPIAYRQLVQSKLVQMLSDHTRGLLTAWHLGRLKDAGELNYKQVSMGKRDNVRAALNGARSAREILGASGITLDYHAIRHMLNLETVDTYEGTYDVHTLVLGREITGFDALR